MSVVYLRKAPSGPELVINDVPIAIGEGFVLRQVDDAESLAAQAVTASYAAVGTLQCGLDNPSAGYAYAARVVVQVTSLATSAAQTLDLRLVGSYDNFATVFQLARTYMSIPAGEVIQMEDQLTLTLGADFATPVVAQTRLDIRAEALCSTLAVNGMTVGGLGSRGGVWLQLQECIAPEV